MSNVRYSVYVIDLEKDVLKESKFRKANPRHVEGNPCVYVGSTACTPAERFQQHCRGYKHNRYVKRYGVELRKNVDKNALPRMSHTVRRAAEAQEQELADELRKKGWAVWSTLDMMLFRGGTHVTTRKTCPHGMPQEAWCSICSGGSVAHTSRVQDPSTFSAHEGVYKRNPTFEIQNNGGVFNKVTRAPFRFGLRKAKMLLDCIEVIEQFTFTTDAGRQNFKIPDNHRWHIRHVPHFTNKFDQLLNEPYLQFEEGSPLKLGLGAKRCQALWELRGEIRDFVKKIPVVSSHENVHELR